MQKGVIGLGIWCVDTTYKINKLPERGKLESIIDSYQCVGGGPSNVLTNLSSLGFKSNLIASSLTSICIAEFINLDPIIDSTTFTSLMKEHRPA